MIKKSIQKHLRTKKIFIIRDIFKSVSPPTSLILKKDLVPHFLLELTNEDMLSHFSHI